MMDASSECVNVLRNSGDGLGRRPIVFSDCMLRDRNLAAQLVTVSWREIIVCCAPAP